MWLLASGAKREIVNNKNYYSSLIETFPQHIPSPYEEQINLDIRRTFPEDPLFSNEDILKKLKNILLAYSRRNLSIGYCQGFNFIVGRLLKIYSSEEEAFWVFTCLIEQFLPLNYYSEMAGVLVDSAILNRLLQKYIPDMYNYFIEIGYEMNLNNMIYCWFTSIYVQNLPYNVIIYIFIIKSDRNIDLGCFIFRWEYHTF